MTATTTLPVGISARPILSIGDITCSVFTLGPGEHTSRLDPRSDRDHILFVVQGRVTVAMNDLTYIVEEQGALHVPALRDHTITADPSRWARLLRIDFAPRQDRGPEIITLPRR